ncbi:MAG: hypothetical protein DRH12_04150 [Deltaproteobacteria bacterium]|nr:MAG: hypothetical protein DRH12_04150 [Deltaproteobacteria bacterium]
MIGKEIGNYRIIGHIGKGGMAVVYRGQHKTLTRRFVAIKMLSAALEGDKSFHERFFREAEVMDRLRHPNIVTLYDFIEHEGQYFIVMEFVDGTTLHHLIKESKGPMAFSQIEDIFRQALDAMAYAHKLGIVHRDIKPSNIMTNKEGQVKITDFGIARILGENFETTLTVTGMGMGSPYYMSPEQVLASKKHPITAASDIYSLGITLYQMITGRLPFSEGGSLYTIMQAHVKDPPPPPSKFIPGLSPAIESIVLKAIEKNPQDRWSSCEELSEALNRAFSQEQKVGEKVTEPVYEPPAPEHTEKQAEGAKAPSAPAKSSAFPIALLIIVVIAVLGIAAGGYLYLTKRHGEAGPQASKTTAQVDKIPSPKGEQAPAQGVQTQRTKATKSEKAYQTEPPPAQPQVEGAKTREALLLETLEKAQQAYETSQLQRAETLVKKVLKEDPKNKAAQDLLGQIRKERKEKMLAAKIGKAESYLKSGNYSSAMAAAEEILRQYPDNTKALEIKKQAEAAADREEKRRLAIEAKLAKAEAYLDADRFAKAAREAEAVLSMDKGNVRAKKILNAAKQGKRQREINSKLAEGRKYLDARKYGMALKVAQEILTRYPGEPRALELKKQAVAGLKRRPSKEEIVATMLKKAEFFLQQGQFHRARVLADKILDLDPDNRRAQDILEMAMEGENRQLFQGFLGQGLPSGPGGADQIPMEGGQGQPVTPTPPIPMPAIPNQ